MMYQPPPPAVTPTKGKRRKGLMIFGIILFLGGLLGGGAIYLFLSKVLTSADENLGAEEFGMVGVLGRLSMPIREGGTGELIYSQGGTRRTCGARAEDAGAALSKGSEVLVTRYEKGLAYVRLWDELAGEVAEQEGRHRAPLG
jgi:hypothetical protein